MNRYDPLGHSWDELLDMIAQALQQASGAFAVAGGISQLDSPFPGPADLVALAVAGITAIACIGTATYNYINNSAPSLSLSRTKEM